MSHDRAHLKGTPPEWLDLYLDDLLEGEDRARFEAEMERDAALREQVALQRRIDLSLRSQAAFDPATLRFDAPANAGASSVASDGARRLEPLEPLPRTASIQPAQPRRLGGGRWTWYGVAAALLLSAAGLYRYTTGVPEEIKFVDPAALYARMQATGFTPEFVCKDDAEFAGAVSKRLGSGLLVSQAPGLNVLGWAYGQDYSGRIVGPDTLVLMTRLDEKHNVLVLMDKLSSDRHLCLPQSTGLHLFRREVGKLVLYEITPLSEPRVLDRVHPPISGG